MPCAWENRRLNQGLHPRRSALAKKRVQKGGLLHRTFRSRSARKAPWPRVPVVRVAIHAERVMKSQSFCHHRNLILFGCTYEMYNGGPVAARGRTVLRIPAFGLPTHHDDSNPRCMHGMQVFAAWAVRSVCCFPNCCFPASPQVTLGES